MSAHLPVGRLMEHEFTCPYCGEEISMVLDLSVGRQTYIEDCEVCCKPRPRYLLRQNPWLGPNGVP